jgi:hypothetical protein
LLSRRTRAAARRMAATYSSLLATRLWHASQQVFFDLFRLFAGERAQRVTLGRFVVEMPIQFRRHCQHLL